jgi:hypothetical protein
MMRLQQGFPTREIGFAAFLRGSNSKPCMSLASASAGNELGGRRFPDGGIVSPGGHCRIGPAYFATSSANSFRARSFTAASTHSFSVCIFTPHVGGGAHHCVPYENQQNPNRGHDRTIEITASCCRSDILPWACPVAGSHSSAQPSKNASGINYGPAIQFGANRLLAARQRFASTSQGLKASGWCGIELGPVELLLNAVKGFFSDLAPRA